MGQLWFGVKSASVEKLISSCILELVLDYTADAAVYNFTKLLDNAGPHTPRVAKEYLKNKNNNLYRGHPKYAPTHRSSSGNQEKFFSYGTQESLE